MIFTEVKRMDVRSTSVTFLAATKHTERHHIYALTYGMLTATWEMCSNNIEGALS